MAIDVQFKLATPNDKFDLLVMMAPFYEHEQITPSLPRATIALDHVLRDPRLGKIWLIQTVNAGKPIGYVVTLHHYSLEFGGATVIIDELYVDPAYRGHGLGTRGIEFLEQELRNNGLKVLYLEVNRTNEKAQRLYRKHGFTDQDRLLLTKVL